MVTWLQACMLVAVASTPVVSAGPHGMSRATNDRPLPESTGATLTEYARELNDARLDVREEATRRLIDDEIIRTHEIVEFVDTQWDVLPPEAIERFLIVSRERYVANPGAIGIQFGDSPTAIIQTVIAGTPAARVLQRGDQFISLNGHVLPESRAQQQPELLREMAGLKAGDLVQARIRRGSEELDVEFALADPRNLPRFEDFIVQMQREMFQQWLAMRQSRFPPVAQMLIDMDLHGLDPGGGDPGSPAAGTQDARAIEELNRRRAQVSQSIARVMEQSSASDSPQRRRELEAEYLPLINEFARLNARLRLLEAAASGRRRR